MATPKSPFLVFQEFISPLLCEQIIDDLGLFSADTNTEGKPIRRTRHHEEKEQIIFKKFEGLIPFLETHYGFNYYGTEKMTFEWYPEGCKSEPQCESSEYLRKKWVRTRERDVSAVLFLSDYQEKVPFDSDFEVYGGKLEFFQHGFGFNPKRGTLIVFPSGPHFINATAPIIAGDLYQVRIHICSEIPYLYQPDNFPGDYRSWFKGLF